MRILRRDNASPTFDERFNYRAVAGHIKLLENITRPDITYATHQCARFYQDPRESHGNAIIHLVKYLKVTREQGIMLDPEGIKSFEVYVDYDFCGNWRLPTAGDNPRTAKFRTGYAILYAICPIIWCSKLQTQITLSTTEVEYIALSQSLCRNRSAMPSQ